MARITRALNNAEIPCPSAADPGETPTHTNRLGAHDHAGHLGGSAPHRAAGVEPAAHRSRVDRSGQYRARHRQVQRWNLPDGGAPHSPLTRLAPAGGQHRLAAGTRLLGMDGERVRVVRVSVSAAHPKVYDITVANTHTFYVAAGSASVPCLQQR